MNRRLVPIVWDSVFSWQNIFQGCHSALCLCGSGGGSERIGLLNPFPLRVTFWLLASDFFDRFLFGSGYAGLGSRTDALGES
jgi:hypothetical protein